MVAAVVIPIVLFYPWVAVYLPEPVRSGISTATGGLLSVEVEKPVVQHVAPKKPLPAPQVSRPTAIASRALNVRETPATTGTVLSFPAKRHLGRASGKPGELDAH